MIKINKDQFKEIDDLLIKNKIKKSKIIFNAPIEPNDAMLQGNKPKPEPKDLETLINESEELIKSLKE